MPVATTAELFRSTNLRVVARSGFSSACCVVTFDSFTDNRTLDRPGFGEAFFQSRGIDAIHVIPRENDWYQYPEIEAAMAQVHAATRGYPRVVTYGSSMGAYAAIRLAGLAGANCALAMSPQFSIDPSIAGFDRRWHGRSKQFRSVWEHRLPFPTLDEAYVVYDPDDLDGRHAALLAGKFAFTPVSLPQSGHTVSGFLQDLGLLQSTVLSVCAGTFDPAPLIGEAWRRRDQSPQHFLARAEKSPRRSERYSLFSEAIRLAPNNVVCLSHFANELTEAREFTKALALYEKALALAPNQRYLLSRHSRALQLSGDLAGALALMDQVVRLPGSGSWHEKRRHRLRRRLLVQSGMRHALRWIRGRWQSLRPALRWRVP